MSHFADLTPHTYTPTHGQIVLNVGWLDVAFPFTRGPVSPVFAQALSRLCERPIHLHRGFHVCQFCPPAAREAQSPRLGNGQVRVTGADGVRYAAPTMVHHYVVVHAYQPPEAFVSAVLRSVPLGSQPTMRYGSAIAEAVIDGRMCAIRVSVGVARSLEQVGPRVRLAPDVNESAASAGAWSGVMFAQRLMGRNSYDIELRAITGDIDCAMAGMGAALAATVAAWTACGDDWHETELGDMHGWSVRQPADI